MKEKPNILITGASGFIGGHVTRYFATKDVNVHCLIRKDSNVDFISGLQLTWLNGDIRNADQLRRAFKGMDYIIHTAARTRDWGDWDDFFQTNINGTLNVLKAAEENGIKDVTITGSVSSYGEEDSSILKDESMPYNSHYSYFLDRIFPSGMNYYRDSKAISTKEAIEFATANDMNLTVVEPVWVYGENEFSSGFFEYLKSVGSGLRIMPGSRKNNFHVVYAKDLAKAYFKVYEAKPKGINRFIIGNEATEKMHMIFDQFCKEAGYKIPVRLPRILIYPLAMLIEITAQMRKSRKAPLLSRARVKMFYDNIGYSTKKAEEFLAFKASTPVEAGISNTVNWYKKHQYL
jgi:nucleoside-diphosphate-sugar epimerase